MDFTYFCAAFVGFFAGLTLAAAFTFAWRHSWWKIIVSAFLAAMALNSLTLINWTVIGRFSSQFLLTDFGFIASYTAVGCLVGAMPLIIARYAWLRLRGRSEG